MHGSSIHLKRGGARALAAEAAGLTWLAEAEGAGGALVARVHRLDGEELVEDLVHAAPPTRAMAEAFGRALAATHAAGAPWFGAPPPAWPGDGFIGSAPLPLLPREEHLGWGEFYARHRVEPYLRSAVDRRRLDPEQAGVLGRLVHRLASGALDHAQPAMVDGAARLHGDLWAGNVVWGTVRDAAPAGVLIDPAAHGGHAETDLAMLALFGCAHLDAVLGAYHEASPLAQGWRRRTALHQVHPLLVHAVLFGGGYGAQAAAAALGYL